MPIEMPIDPDVRYMKIDPKNIKSDLEDEIYKTYRESREKLESKFKQAIEIDDVEEIDLAPGLGRIKVSLGDEDFTETAEMDYDTETKKVKFMHSEVKGSSFGETTTATVDFKALPGGGEKLESKIKVVDDKDGNVTADVEVHYTVDSNGILTYENKSSVSGG